MNQFSGDAIGRIKKAVQYVEAQPRNMGRQDKRTARQVRSAQTFWAKITSTGQTGGYYPATLWLRDDEAGTWTDLTDAIWVLPPNGETLAVDTFYLIRESGQFAGAGDPRSAWAAVVPGSGGGSLELVNYPATIVDAACTEFISDSREVCYFVSVSPGVDRIEFRDASVTQVGVVNVGGDPILAGSSQSFRGKKIFTLASPGTDTTPHPSAGILDSSLAFNKTGAGNEGRVFYQPNIYLFPPYEASGLVLANVTNSQAIVALFGIDGADPTGSSPSATLQGAGQPSYAVIPGAPSPGLTKYRGGWGTGNAGDTFKAGLWINGGTIGIVPAGPPPI